VTELALRLVSFYDGLLGQPSRSTGRAVLTDALAVM
jgi:hypothetical protein